MNFNPKCRQEALALLQECYGHPLTDSAESAGPLIDLIMDGCLCIERPNMVFVLGYRIVPGPNVNATVWKDAAGNPVAFEDIARKACEQLRATRASPAHEKRNS